MEPNQLKQIISDLDLTQAEFARLVDVSPSAVAQWLSGARGIPGPVTIYLDLLLRLPPAIQQHEVSRVKQRAPTMRNGIYNVEFVGTAGMGSATLTFKDGLVYGVDSAGGSYDGTSVYDPASGLMLVTLAVVIKANTATVAGGDQYPFDWTLEVATFLKPDSDVGEVDVQTNIGQPLRARYRFIRYLPLAA